MLVPSPRAAPSWLAYAIASLTEGVWVNQCLTRTHPSDPTQPIAELLRRSGRLLWAGATQPPFRDQAPLARWASATPARMSTPPTASHTLMGSSRNSAPMKTASAGIAYVYDTACVGPSSRRPTFHAA